MRTPRRTAVVCIVVMAVGAASANAGGVKPIDSGHILESLACPSATQCTAVDHDGNEVTFDPRTGTVNAAGVKTIENNGQILSSVACPSTTQCTAVESTDDEVTFDPQTGAVNAAGLTPIDSGRDLFSVACSSLTQCTAVDINGAEVTFDPQTGAVNAAGVTPIDSGMDLYGIACLSGTQCVAVDQNGGEVTFDPQSGTASSVEPVDSGVALISVSCPSATQCTAVPLNAQEVTFNPQTGAVNSAGVKTVDAHDFEDSVTCPTAKQCTTVDESGREVTFDPRTGTVNSRGAVPLESAVALTGKVSCPSAKQCTAGDQNGNEITFDPLPPAPSAPSISISRPRQNAAYTGGEVVDAEYSCTARPGSGPITLCSGSVASGSPISTSPGKHTFTVRASDKADKSSTLAHDYTVYARNGSGKMTASPSSVVHSTPHHTLRFTYEAARGGIARGTLILTVPAGWSTPSTSGAAPGSVKASQGRLSVSGRKIIVSIPILASAHTLTITYGSQAAGGPGATAPNTTGTQAWPAQERSIPQGTLTNIASPPHIAIT